MQLLVIQQIGALYVQHLALRRHLADHALDVMHAVFLYRTAIELVEVLARRAHVDVEHVHLGVRVFVADQHGVLGRVHTADLGAVFLALLGAGTAARADALHEHDRVRMLAVGRAQQRAARRTGGVHQALQLQRGDDVLRLRIGELVEFIHGDRLEPGGDDDRTVLFFDMLVLGLIVDRADRADLGADTAFAVFQHHTVVRVDRGHLRHGLRKGDIDRAAGIHAEVELVRHLLLRAFLGAQAAAGADILLDIAGAALDRDVEVADEALHRLHLGIREDADLFVLRHVDHLRREDTGRAVKGGEGLVQLCHLAADRGLRFHDIDGEARVGDVQRGLDAGDAAADDQRPLGHGALSRCQRRVKAYLRHGSACQNDGLGRAGGDILVHPGALLTDIRDLDHVRVEAGGRGRFAERRLVHPGRAGADDDAGQLMLGDGGADYVLPGLRAHIRIIRGDRDARLVLQGLGDGFDVDRPGDVRAAVANENTDPLHGSSSPFLFRIFAQGAHQRLLRHLVVEQGGDIVRLQAVLPLLTDDAQAQRLHQLGRLHAARAALDAREARQALVQRRGLQQRLQLAALDHVDELVRMVFHLVIRRAAAGAFAAAHAFFWIDAAHAQHLFLQPFVLILHRVRPP